ncbi:MAG: flippase-like domain-containing protein [Lactobacillaceae bacterium]|jgi:uncharacterized protein (TIRG00374 family)|nr:flippase-like domain-containing protein [Lactobacillaceae bacterium]
MSNKERITWLLITIAIGVSVFYFNFRSVPLDVVVKQISDTNYWWLLVALLIMVAYFFTTAKIVVTLVDKNHRPSIWQGLRVALLEQFGNGVTPMAIGGQPMQMLGLSQAGVPIGEATSVSLMKFIIYQGMIVVTFLISLVFGFRYVADHLKAMTVLVVFGVVIHLVVLFLLIFVMFSPRVTKTMASLVVKPIEWFTDKNKARGIHESLNEKIEDFHAVSKLLFSQKKVLFKTSLLTLLQLIFFYVVPYFILLAFKIPNVNLLFVVALNVILTLAVSIFPIPGGSGGAEIGFKMLFASFITYQPQLILAMLLWRILTYYLGLFAGIVAYNFIPNNEKRK